MTKYIELSNAFAAQQHEEREYWQGLQVKASQIAAGFGSYLGLESPTYDNMKGGKVRYIQLRKKDGAEEAHFTQLEGANASIHFDVTIALESEPGVFPKEIVRIPLKIGKSAQGFVSWSDEINISSRIELDSNDWTDLYDQMFARLQEHLSRRAALEVYD